MHRSRMVVAVGWIGNFCQEMQIAFNELSQYDINLYLEIGTRCDHLKESMQTATENSEALIRRGLMSPDCMRSYMRETVKRVWKLGRVLDIIANFWLRERLSWESGSEHLNAELSVSNHMSQLEQAMQMIRDLEEAEFYLDDD